VRGPGSSPALTTGLASPVDIAALVELASTTFRDAYRDLLDAQEIEDYIAAHFTRATLSATLADSSSRWITAAKDGRPLGYALLRDSQPPPCVLGPMPIELGRLYVRQEVMGTGCGLALMRAVQAEARKLHRRTLWLAVYDRNVRAIDFYRKFGFVEVGTTDFRFGGRVYADPVMAAAVR